MFHSKGCWINASEVFLITFINLMVINELTRDQDSYVRSNYLYKDREGKLTQGPLWDYNLIMGTGCCFDNRNTQGWQYQHPYNRGLEQNRGDNPDWIVKLMQDPNYAQRFEDRWFELRQGPLSLDGLFARIDAQTIPLTEAAERNFDKWNILGNGNPGFPSPVTNTWQEQIDFIKNWLTQRVAWIDSQLLDPPAPEYSVPGGLVAEGTQVSVTADAAQITTDTVVVAEGDSAAWFVPTDNTLGLTWTEAAFDDATWSTGPTGIGYENTPADYANLIQTRVRPQETCATCTTVMARMEFTVDDLANVDQINLRMKYDDGFVAYINGQEVARKNVTGTPNFNSSASDHPDGSAVVFEDSLISVEPGLLNAGSDNVLAIQVVNSGTGSSDQLLIAEFVLQQIESVGSAPIYLTVDGSDPRGTDGQPTAPLYDGTPLTVNEDSLVQARSLVNGEWSALSVAQYTVGVIPIVITELNYNPHPPSDAELTALPGIDNDDLEFIEVQNVGDRPTNLANLAFVDGVDFTFPFYQLAPGERALIVKQHLNCGMERGCPSLANSMGDG